MPKAGRRWRSERGQSTALVASMLFVMVLFVGLVVDVGQAVNRRIALQVVADAGAYTGASVMAVGMNQLAVWNRAMQYAWVLFTSPPSPMYTAFELHETSCNAADVAEGIYGGAMGILDRIFWAENMGYAMLARSEAESVSEANAADLFPSERLQYAEFNTDPQVQAGHWVGGGGLWLPGWVGGFFWAFREPFTTGTERVPDGTPVRALNIPGILGMLLVPAQSHNWYTCQDAFPMRLEFRVKEYPVWYRRSRYVDPTTGNPASSFVWVVTAPPTRALMFDSWLGAMGGSIPAMQAVAVAKPVGGDIEAGRDEYATKMIPVATLMPTRRAGGWWAGQPNPFTSPIGWIPDPGSRRGGRIVTH